MFTAIEGGTGAGKTSIANALVSAIIARGHRCLYTREPGGSPKAELLRERLRTEDLTPDEQRLIFLEIRQDHEANVIAPALRAGLHVVTDRFRGAYLSYHGFRMGRPIEPLEEELRQKTPFLIPDKTILLSIDPLEGLKRKGIKDSSVFDRDVDGLYLEHEGYHYLAKRDGWHVVDASQPMAEVIAAVILAINV